MNSVEGIGKTVEQAIDNALLELKVAREDVDIKILNQGGLLKKAKVLVTISPEALEKYEKKNAIKAEMLKEETNEEKQEETKIETAEVKEEVKEESKEVLPTSREEVDDDDEDDEREERKTVDPQELLENILKSQNLTAEITVTEDDRYVRYMLAGENLNTLIGYHGECLYALSSYVSQVCRLQNHKRVLLDINNYRSKRADTLISLAQSVADKVAKTGRYHKFEPMDASERKVIHTALQNDSRVSTMSKGEEPNRYLMVFPTGDESFN